MDKARARVLVSGKVQGVFFRSRTRDAAVRLGLAGWVANLPDGRVEAVLEGSRDSVEKAVEFLRKGPPGSGVSGVEVEWKPFRGEFSTFEVRY
jgi:acylphosphatase